MNGYKAVPVIIGSEANFVPEGQRREPELSHNWRCYVTVSPALVKSVQFRLHESFTNSVTTITEPPFEIKEAGWGEFNIQIKIVLFNDEKITTSHYLALHSDTYPFVSERIDTIVYRGKELPLPEEYDFSYDGEEEEYKKIDDAINHVYDLYSHVKNEHL